MKTFIANEKYFLVAQSFFVEVAIFGC